MDQQVLKFLWFFLSTRVTILIYVGVNIENRGQKKKKAKYPPGILPGSKPNEKGFIVETAFHTIVFILFYIILTEDCSMVARPQRKDKSYLTSGSWQIKRWTGNMFFRLENIKHLSQIYQQNIIHFCFSKLYTAETLANKSYTFSSKKSFQYNYQLHTLRIYWKNRLFTNKSIWKFCSLWDSIIVVNNSQHNIVV